MATLTQRPCRGWSRSRSSARVASACSRSNWSTVSTAASSQLRLRSPACGRGAIVPVVRRRWSNFSTNARLT
jgi:hypothetical protein